MTCSVLPIVTCSVLPCDVLPCRWGPAQFWYDMLELPEDCANYDYGLRG